MAIIKQYHKDTDTTYVYESESYWDPELKQARSKRRCIGKVDPKTGEIVPTGTRGRKKKETSGENSGEKYDKLMADYSRSQEDIRSLNGRISELEKELSECRKQIQKYKEVISKINKLSTEV